MADTDRTKEQVMNELRKLRRRIAELEALEAERGREEEIKRQNEFLNSVLSSLTHPFYVIDANDYTIKLANHTAKLGDLLRNPTCYALTHKSDKPCAGEGQACPLEDMKKTKKPVVVEHIHYDVDGNARYIEVHGYPILDAEGNVIQMIEYNLDITERKQAEEAAQEAREYAEAIIATVIEPLVVLDADLRVISANRSFYETFKVSPKETEGQLLYELGNRQWDIPKVRKLLEEVLPESSTIERFEVEYDFPTIGHRVMLLNARQLLRGADKPPHILVGMEDITDRQRLEEEERKIEKLQSIGTLAGGIAHDFNNILTGILGNITLVESHIEPEGKAAERLLEAKKACLRARDLSQQLLTFARGGTPIKKTVSIAELLEESATFALTGSKVKAEFSFPDDLWSVEIDEGQMNQVITNLVINADVAMPEGGILSIRAKNTVIKRKEALPLPRGTYVEIAIQDYGVGIPKEHLSKVFDPYFTTKRKGSGLGLATAYSIIRNHDGYITVESELGVGTTFHIYLPNSEKSALEKEAVAEEASVHGKGRILVTDDEEMIREMLSNMLSAAGYEVEPTSDGAEAIDRYAKAKESGQPFDAVILDLTVPGGMGGKETIQKLLEIDPDVKAIVSSGYSNDPIMSKFREYGFSAIATKPYSVGELERILRRMLGAGRRRAG